MKYNPVVFLHIPKTAGTSVHEFLSKQFSADDVCPRRTGTLQDSEIYQYKYFSGHFQKWDVDRISGNKFVFTFLRHPKKRILSLYYFWRSHPWAVINSQNLVGPKAAKSLSLLDFLLCNSGAIQGNIDNAMVRQLLPKEAKLGNEDSLQLACRAVADLNFVGFQERFDHDFPRLVDMLKLKRPAAVPETNVGGQRRDLDPVVREEITEAIDSELDRLTSLDIKLYEFARARFPD